LISPDGEQLGLVKLEKALEMARERKLDLVEVAANANPPVAKILDYGKFRYDQARKERQNRKKQHTVQIKGIRLTPNIGEHDLEIKANKARAFLEAGDRLKVTVFFHGRLIARRELGEVILNKFLEFVQDVADQENPPKMEGPRNMVVNLVPSKKSKKK